MTQLQNRGGISRNELGLVVAFAAILAVLGFRGASDDVASSQDAELERTLHAIAMASLAAYESSPHQAQAILLGSQQQPLAAQGLLAKSLCPSASSPVPEDESQVSGKPYLLTPKDWRGDRGWGCLRFSGVSPEIHNQYDYQATQGEEARFVGIARSDRDGDGDFDRYELGGTEINDGGQTTLKLDPKVTQE